MYQSDDIREKGEESRIVWYLFDTGNSSFAAYSTKQILERFSISKL